MTHDLGYKIIDCPPPTIDKINAAKAEIPSDKLRELQSRTSPLGYEQLGWGHGCEKLFHDGLDLWSDPYTDDLLQGAYNSKINVSKVVIWMQNPTQLIRYKAGRELVFIYRPLEEALGPHNGFTVVEGSHRMRPEEFLKAEAIEIHLKPGQVLVLDGETVIEYPMAGGGGIGLMRCLSKSKH